MLQKSRHNITAQVPGTGLWLIANVLSGNADFLSEDEWRQYTSGRFADPERWAGRGYLVDPDEEERRFRAAYLEFASQREDDEIQIFYVPWYHCNFACDYCYQATYPERHPERHEEVLDAFFRYVDAAFAGKRRYFTLFGGEPLLPGARHREVVARFFEQARRRDTEVAVVTNGYAVPQYMDILSGGGVREVQVTVDGLGDTHDRRRPLKGGGSTFEAVVAGVDALLEADIPVNLRVVLDKDNIGDLAPLARFAAKRGWTAHPAFKTQLGRNYELHACQARAERLYSRLEMVRDVADQLRAHPEIADFHRPSFHFVKHLADTGALPDPVFDACPGTKTEWAFDVEGGIYACTATVGKPGERLGTFFPQVQLDEEAVAVWQDRDVLSIPACRTCPAALVCGGGCGSLAKNHHGDLHAPDCRPVAEIAAVGATTMLLADS